MRINNTLSTIGLSIAALAGHASAQALQGSNYHVSHAFNLDAPAADVGRVTVYEFRHAWASGQGQQDEIHAPLAQDPGFDPYGTESPGPNHAIYNSGFFGNAVRVFRNLFTIPNTGSPGTPFCVSVGLPQGSTAEACNAVFVSPWVDQAPLHIDGSIESFGYADANVTGRGAAWAYAYSTVAIRIDSGVTLQNGMINWTFGALTDSVGDGVTNVEVQDPVQITATNTSTGEVREYNIVAIDMAYSGDGHVEINGTNLEVNVPEFSLDISIDPAVIDPSQAGDLQLEVIGGTVQTAVGTGVYAGLLPPIGAHIPFDMHLPPIDLDYDLGLNPNDPWEVSIDLGGGGGGLSALEGCPADLAEPFGVLDLQDVNAFVLGFVEMLPIADLNGDGIHDLADVGLFIESFLAGCTGTDG